MKIAKYNNNSLEHEAEEHFGAEEPPPDSVSEIVYSVDLYDINTGPEVASQPEMPRMEVKKEIKRGGPQRCPCGSGKKPQDCCMKHLNPKDNPLNFAKDFEIDLTDREIKEYDTPSSHKEYSEKGIGKMQELESERHESEDEEPCPCGSGKPKSECFCEIEEE